MEEQGIIRNWNKFKPLMLKKWKKLDPGRFEEYQPTIDVLISIIQENYNIERQQILQDIENLDQQILT